MFDHWRKHYCLTLGIAYSLGGGTAQFKGDSAMARSFQVLVIRALGLALACAVIASQPACAEQLSCGDITLQEGTSGHITCTFTNNTSGDIIIDSSLLLFQQVVVRQNSTGLKVIDYSAGSLQTVNHDRHIAMARNSD